MSKPIILFEDEYSHVVNNDCGTIELIEGPCRFTLPSNKSEYGSTQKKIILKENEYVEILNPYNADKKESVMGEKQIRVGPKVFSLYPQEASNGVKSALILNKNSGAVIQQLEDSKERKAGELWLIKGPALYIPKTSEKLYKTVSAMNVSQGEAIYIRNTTNSELKLVNGPVSYIPEVDEEYYYKRLNNNEYEALKHVGITTNSSYKAFNIQIQKNECVCIVDYKTSKQYYVVGPKSHCLGPHEGVKVLDLSAGVPKKENQVKSAVLRLGPDFMNDSFVVRTKDNAVLNLVLNYKWRFILDDSQLDKIFASDFIGYSCQSLRSRIREESARHDFEVFNKSAAKILRSKIFKNYEIKTTYKGKEKTEKVTGRLFKEFSFLVFELDVKSVSPVDAEIVKLLDESIKSSMEILCSKLNDSAENESEKEKIESEVEIANLRKNLIEIENANLTKETIEKAIIEGKALIEKAKAEKKAQDILEKSKISLETSKMKNMMELLKGEKGDKYLQYMKVMNLHKNVSSACIIPKDTKTLFLPSSQPLSVTNEISEEHAEE